MIELLNEMNGNFENKCGSAKYTTNILDMQHKIAELYPSQIYNIYVNGVNNPSEYPDLSYVNTSAPSQEAFAEYASSLASLQNSYVNSNVNQNFVQMNR